MLSAMSEPIERPPTLLAMPTYLASWVAKRARADVLRALAEYGLATADHGVLVALADFGALSQQQLADRLDADKSHVVRLIDQLQGRELITRASDPTDRRRHRIELTPAGRKLVRVITPITEDIEAAHLKSLSAAERRTLATLLQRVLESQDEARAAQRH
jgi:MarR family transcriptional regulator, lower aerobic nicotinate degradation pathway regulator